MKFNYAYLIFCIPECADINTITLFNIDLASKDFMGYMFFNQELFDFGYIEHKNYIKFQLDVWTNTLNDYIQKYDYRTINDININNWYNHESPDINSKYKKESINIDNNWIKYKKYPFGCSLYDLWISPFENEKLDHSEKTLLKKRLKLIDLK